VRVRHGAQIFTTLSTLLFVRSFVCLFVRSFVPSFLRAGGLGAAAAVRLLFSGVGLSGLGCWGSAAWPVRVCVCIVPAVAAAVSTR